MLREVTRPFPRYADTSPAFAAERRYLEQTDTADMTLLNEPVRAQATAAAILGTIERAKANERNLGLADLRNELPELAEFDLDRLKTILIATGCRSATDLVAAWLAACPDDRAPLLALESTQAWLAEPTQERSARSSELSEAALNSFVRSRAADRLAQWPAHAWFARACAWLADAPEYGWQSVPALLGLMKAGARASVLEELAHQIELAHRA